MSHWRRLAAAIAVAAVTAACSAQPADQPQRPADTGYVGATKTLTLIPPQERVLAPDISGPLLGGDRTISISDFDDQVIVVNVWGSWCGPCKAEVPDLQAASQDTAGIAQFIGLNTRDRDPGPPLAFNRARGVTYPSIFDPDGSQLVRLAGTLPPRAIPSTLIIDSNGRMAARIVGPVAHQTLSVLIQDIASGK